MIRYTRDNGVSPVIAVLLILAMTVAAAGIVAVVATGMTGDLQNGKQVGLIVKPAARGGDVLVTVVSGKDVPELTKLEVIDAGAADAQFREVRLSNGGEVASFTAGAGYVAKNVADPGDFLSSYTTPIGVRGSFADGTETVLLNTKLTFANVWTVSQLDGKLSNLEIYLGDDTDDSKILDDFLRGDNIYVKLNDLPVGGNNNPHLRIQIPVTWDKNMPVQIIATAYKADGTTNPLTSSASGQNTPRIDLYNADNFDHVIITINMYEPNKGLNGRIIATQTGTIYITH
ncbi:MAG TPA: type IV pilin [Methanocorpusculum sp.]|nr:type IV pilin [Methanocorpusculum sp.]HJK81171.1 type IV pilin [Methanocorpusculum sp.]